MGDRGHNRHGPKRWGLLCPFRAELGPRLIQCGLGRVLLPYQVASSSIQPFGHKNMGQKLGESGCALCSGGTWVPIEHKVAWAEAHLHTNWHLDASSRLATIKMGRKLGALPPCSAPFLGRGTGSPSSTMWPGPGPPPCEVSSWSI